MASSMCGPSNALSSLQKHTIADRSLQQDRIQSPASSSQLFRTPTTHSNQQLDNEFSQFSSGRPPQDARSHTHFASLASPLNHAPQLDGWASDFQRLHLSAPVNPLLQQQQQQQPQRFGQSWVATNWHEEFMQRQQPASHVAEPLLRGPNMGMYSGGFSPELQMGRRIQAGNNVQQQQNVTEQFDDAAFEQAFEDARVQLEERRERQDREQLLGAIRETVVEEKKKEGEVKDKEHDSDELARTAAQLLDSLSGNHSQKFQDSMFLALMRRLRDREVKVEGDKMVETVKTPYKDHQYN